MSCRTRALSLLARVSMRANRARGGIPHLTICAEMWILDRRLWCAVLDAMILVILWERHQCRNQYIRYGINKCDTASIVERGARSWE